MPTKFSKIYDRAIFKFHDYSFLNAIMDFKEALLQKYLMSAIVDFQYACTVDLNDYNLEEETFNVELDNEMMEILASGIAFYWLSSQAMNRELLKNRIHNSDYTSYSPANLLKEIISLRDMMEVEYRGRINTYSFRHGGIESRRV